MRRKLPRLQRLQQLGDDPKKSGPLHTRGANVQAAPAPYKGRQCSGRAGAVIRASAFGVNVSSFLYKLYKLYKVILLTKIRRAFSLPKST